MAVRTYTEEEINKFNRTFTAKKGVFYINEFGETFIGTRKGNLVYIPTAETIPLTDQTTNETGFPTVDSAVASALGRTYENIIDFGSQASHGEETIVEFEIMDSKIKKGSKVFSYVVQADEIIERSESDAVLERLMIGPASIVENQKVTMLVYAPNGTHGRYKIKTQIS